MHFTGNILGREGKEIYSVGLLWGRDVEGNEYKS